LVETISIFIGVILIIILGIWFFGERWRPLRPSTRKFMKEAGLRRILNLQAFHGYIYLRWTNQYVNLLLNKIGPRMNPARKIWLLERYHGKILTLEHAHSIITNDKDIPLHDLEQIIPYQIARDIVLKGPPDVAVYECSCRHSRENPCQPTQVCMIVGQPFVDFILEHNPKSSRKLTQTEALELLQSEHERGHLHSAWFKDACIDRFYSICNCCKCCCGGIEAMVKYDVPSMASSGYIAQLDNDICTACGTCIEVCPFSALSENEICVAVDWELCMGCGICVELCPNEAISLVRDEKKGVPLDVRLLA
jgi:Pyruvate/2-oxoacid:ferredoxin oxidoreductase delta subunit